LRPRKTFSNWLFNRYLLIIRNEENFAEKSTVSFTYAKVIVLLVTIFMIILVMSFFLVETILAQWFDPRHSQMEANRNLIQLSLRLDSLEFEVNRKQQFINNFQRILKGDIDSDSLKDKFDNRASEVPVGIQSSTLSAIDSQFRRRFETAEASLLTISNDRLIELEEMFMFSPIDGIISQKYDVKNEHYGVDVVSRKNEPVRCIADGTVILASWTQDSGYVIAIQHRGGLISVYKHNDELLEKVGNFVSAGGVISITGNTGDLTDGTHLHFELWQNGSPVNPEEFVSF